MTEVIFEDRYLIDKLRKIKGVKIDRLYTALHIAHVSIPYSYEDGTSVKIKIFQRNDRSSIYVAMDVNGWALEPRLIKNINSLEREIVDYVMHSMPLAEMYRKRDNGR
jgi:phage regulator Rha-like protein